MQEQPSGIIKPQDPTPEPTTPEPHLSGPMAVSQSFASPPTEPMQSPESNQPTLVVPPAKPKRFRKMVPIVLIGVLLLGASAAGYYTYVLPNQPENVLLTALTNLVDQKEFALDTKIDYAEKGETAQAVAIDMRIETNVTNNQAALSGTVGYNGAQFPYEVRSIEGSLYAKVGGLDGIGQLLSLAGDEYSAYAPVIEQANDKWYVIDRSFSESLNAGSTCSFDTSLQLTDSDKNTIKNAYEKHPLFIIKSTAKEKVGSEDTTKFVVDPTAEAEAEAFFNEITSISLIKNAKDCLEEGASGGDEEITPPTSETLNGTLSIYVSGDKQVKKIEFVSEDDDGTINVSGVFDYRPITVSAPEDASPIQELFFGFLGSSLEEYSLDAESFTDL